MLHKRSRAAYEADSHAAETPFVVFGTPLGPLDSGRPDNGSFVPIHKQEVRDEQGRRRLHGAFTGGWSAGYFNTVGSKEGWTPSKFVSSRQGRRTDESSTRHGQRPEDFMDDEDLADVADSRRIQTTDSFAGLGGRSQAQPHNDGLAGLVHLHGYTMGFTLLRKMGWRDGQGIGPKIRRPARLHDDENHRGTISAGEAHLFAPDDITVIKITRKLDRAGLGAELVPHGNRGGDAQTRSLEDVTEEAGGIGHVADAAFLSASFKKPKRNRQGGIGIGVLNDTGSDDEDDPYSMGPRISFNRSLGGSKPKRSKKPGNPALAAKLTFTSRPSLLPQTMTRTCQDGRPPLPGFVLGSSENFVIPSAMNTIFQPPCIPPDWTSSKGLKPIRRGLPNEAPGAIPKTLIYNPGSRAAALGEAPLRGKSVFDFMSAESRARLVTASGNTNLPQAKGEIPPGFATSDEQKIKDGIQGLPFLEKETAIAAIRRGHGVGGPYADDESRQSRYRAFLEHFAFGSAMPAKPDTMTAGSFVKELAEFHNCAKLFKPMTGFMATRFTVSSSSVLSPGVGNTGDDTAQIVSGAPVTQRQDPAEEAANIGLYGHLTRSIVNFYPTRLLCKRFNVRQPNDLVAHSTEGHIPLPVSSKDRSDSLSKTERPLDQEGQGSFREAGGSPAHANDDRIRTEPQRPADDVFKAVFGDSDDDVLD